MNERLFARLQVRLATEPVVLASVLETRGATPRKGGSRMLIGAGGSEGSIGGGMAEAQVIAAANALLQEAGRSAVVEIDLTGRQGAAGICGGHMRIGLRRWQGADDRLRVASIAETLAIGNSFMLERDDLGGGEPQTIEPQTIEPQTIEPQTIEPQRIWPDPRLLIVGAGHCGLALHDLANTLDFDVWVHDERSDELAKFDRATRLSGPFDLLRDALDTPREVFAVLLNRDFRCDVDALRTLCQRPPRYIGMMGSARRIGEVRAALPEHAAALAALRAPVGLDIGAQTPHEIAISILAELIQLRSASDR
ncbi:XdhC family protein [Lysobacter hankyongensis]|uniref:XdhC/CoxI family protein n=1 Tax=Lysobacter hankyongensis TaxID=1176535 RepID=A0ABP9AFH5_9GAMM